MVTRRSNPDHHSALPLLALAVPRTQIEPHKGDKRYVRRKKGKFNKSIYPKSTEEERMLKKLALATAAVGLLMSTASADYYIVQEKATKKCKVVETRPTETTWIQIGPAAFKTQSDAEKQIKTVCVEKR